MSEKSISYLLNDVELSAENQVKAVNLIAERDRYKRERDELANLLKPIAQFHLADADLEMPELSLRDLLNIRATLSTIKD